MSDFVPTGVRKGFNSLFGALAGILLPRITMVWTHFRDNYSGASHKTEWTQIFIELPRDEAIELFEKLFEFSPMGTTCDCCGVDYWIEEVDGSKIGNRAGHKDSVKIINEYSVENLQKRFI